MEISNANPIKFWPTGTQTFNVKTETGIDRKCYFAPFDATKDIKIQLSDETGYTYEVLIIDTSGATLETIPMTEVSGVYSVSFKMSDYTIDNQKVKLKINRKYAVIDSDFASDLDGWINTGSGTNDWAWNSGAARLAYTNPSTGKNLRKSVIIPDDATGNLIVDLNRTITGTFGSIDFVLRDSGGSTIDSEPSLATGTSSFEIDNYTGTAFIDIIENAPGVSASYVWLINDVYVYFDYGVVYESDYLQIATNSENVYIQYSNENNFAGLDYSADTIFGTYVKAKFFHERFPEENESEGFSDGSFIKLSGSVKKQKLLQIEPVPYYKHEQLKIILQHNYILIDGQQWEKEENYEMQQLNEKNPFNTGSVWLTLKENSYFTNIYGTV